MTNASREGLEARLGDLTLEQFEPLQGSLFRIALSDAVIELRLESVTPVRAGDLKPKGRQPFALTFRGGPPGRYLPQRTYTLEHETLGALPIFLVPISPDAEGIRYEAIFT